MGMGHGAHLEGRDLVVVQVSGDEALRGIGIFHDAQVPLIDPVPFQPLPVFGKIDPYRAHGQAVRAQQLHVVNDVPPGTAKLVLYVRDDETDIQHVYLVRQYVFPETSRIDHDPVISERTADERSHADNNSACLVSISGSTLPRLPMIGAR